MALKPTDPFVAAPSSQSPLDRRVEEIFADGAPIAQADPEPGAENAHDHEVSTGFESWRDVVLAGLPLAETLARRYHGRGADADDLLQVARLGLVKAARCYRPRSPSGFTAYAVPTISGEIKRFFRDHQWLVRPPRALQELQQQVVECRRALGQARGRMVTDAEVAQALGVDSQRVRAAALSGSAYRAASEDLLREHPTPNTGYDQMLDRLALADLFASLGPRDSRLLWLRFVEGRSQSTIAEEFGVSQMQVSRLLRSLLARLRVLAQAEQAAG